ncbi:MAG: hypothetical protein ABSF80_03860 [Chitinispirillaceae bacterium]|jgi:hypothetical protein
MLVHDAGCCICRAAVPERKGNALFLLHERFAQMLLLFTQCPG